MKTFASTIEPLEARIAPATIIVTNDADSGMGSLRAALALADDVNHPGHDTIVFHLPTNELTSDDAFVIKLTSGALTSLGNVTVTGPGAGRLIIDGNGSVTHDRVLTVNDGHNSGITATDSPVTISGLSIIDGNVTGNGGGIYSTESLTLKNVVVSGNTASGNGGGVCAGAADYLVKVSISNSLITANNAANVGGGLELFALKSLSLTGTTITGNTDTSTTHGAGGIYAGMNKYGTGMKISGCQISSNKADHSGGVFLNSYNLNPAVKMTISATKITGNTSTDNIHSTNMGVAGGGGLYVEYGNAVITGCTISDNRAVYNGGGIEAKGFTSLTISSSTISDNQTTATNTTLQGGGGVFMEGNSVDPLEPVKITGSHITGNQTAEEGGGLYADNGIALTISSSTISGNHAGGGGGVSTLGRSGANKVDLTVTGCSISDNAADYHGGGIEALGSSVVSITGSKVTGNIALGYGAQSGGGGIYIIGSSVTLKNVVMSGNFAIMDGGGLAMRFTTGFHVSGGSFTGNSAAAGGGIYTYECTGSVLGVTISGNAATSKGGGVFFNAGLSADSITLQIAKVTGNTAPTDPNAAGTFTPFP